ncbi:MAG: hypothetical protein ACHQD9_08670 [Chitinophagales bacterium]
MIEPMNHGPEKSTEEVFNYLLKKASASVLKSFLEGAAREDHALRERFIIRFIESSSIPSEEKYSLLIRSIAQLANYDPEKFRSELFHFLAKAKQFSEARDYLGGFNMAKAFIGEFKLLCKNERRLVSESLIEIFFLLSFISKSDAGFELKEKIFNLLLNQIKILAGEFNSAEKEKWIQTLIDSSSENSQLQHVLELIVELIGQNRSQFGESMDEKEEEQFLQMKLKILQLLGRDDDIRHLLESNRKMKSFRLKLIDSFIQHEELEEAKEMIKEGRRTELKKGNVNLSSEWDELLLKIALEENDVKSVRNLALQLFLSNEYDFQFFHLLKQHYDPSRWKAQLDRVVTSIKREKAFATKGIHAIAKIFVEEQEWDKLLLLLEKNSNLEFVNQYADYLKEKFPEQLIEIYRKAIRRFAEKFMGPEADRIVTDALRKMQSLPDSKEIVQSLAIELKVNYRQRRAFVEELNKVVL